MGEHVNVADLPDGSIVASRDKVWIRNWPSATSAWRCTNGGYYNTAVLQQDLDSYGYAEVLRHGYGEDT